MILHPLSVINHRCEMDKHPYDWLIHAALCFTPIYFGWATWFVVATVAVMWEAEQWKAAGKPEFTHYFFYQMLGDLVADAIGIIGGLYAS